MVCVDIFRVVRTDFREMCFLYLMYLFYLMYFFLFSCMRYRHAVADVIAYCVANKQK